MSAETAEERSAIKTVSTVRNYDQIALLGNSAAVRCDRVDILVVLLNLPLEITEIFLQHIVTSHSFASFA